MQCLTFPLEPLSFQISLLFNVETTSSCTVSILSPKWLATISKYKHKWKYKYKYTHKYRLATSHSCLASASLDPTSWVLFGGPAGGDLAVNGTQIKTVEDIVSQIQNTNTNTGGGHRVPPQDQEEPAPAVQRPRAGPPRGAAWVQRRDVFDLRRLWGTSNRPALCDGRMDICRSWGASISSFYALCGGQHWYDTNLV